jgi:hypothetical protein
MSVPVSAMPQRSPALRACWLLAAVVQLLLPGAAAWADARVDTAGAHATAHIESHTTSSCARVHPPDCALCHFLTAPLAPRRPATLRVAGAGARVAPPAEPARLLRTPARLHPQPRAPPALS